MNERLSDFELLRDFLRRGDQGAFTAVVRRHLDLVYGTALRKLEDPSAAEEVTQNVFAALSGKAWQFAPDDSLPAWLHRTALLESKSWLRTELRRRRREQSAAELGATMKTSEEQHALRELVPLLDEGLLALGEKERAALLLRYYEGQSLKQVGAALEVGEDAAQKRVANALQQLARFFQRRGFKTATPALAVTALEQTVSSAPVAVATSVVASASHLTPPAASGLIALLCRTGALTKAQTATVCVGIAAIPLAWQWTQDRAATRQAASSQRLLAGFHAQEEQLTADLEQQRVRLAQLNVAVGQATQAQASDAPAKWNSLAARIRGLLTDANYRWPDDLPYVRIPKSVIKDLELQAMFSASGKLSEPAREVLAMTPEEQTPTEQALANYWNGVYKLMSSHAYETNAVAGKPGRLAKTVVIPPLGADLQNLAQETKAQLAAVLSEDREKILFGGWDEGAIQIFWPGNLWKISEQPQTFTVWVDPNPGIGNGSQYGARWSSTLGSTSTEGEPGSLSVIPSSLFSKFFQPWLEKLGVSNSTTFFLQ